MRSALFSFVALFRFKALHQASQLRFGAQPLMVSEKITRIIVLKKTKLRKSFNVVRKSIYPSFWQKSSFSYPAVRTGSSNTHFFSVFLPRRQDGSSNTHFFSVVLFTPPSGRGLAILLFFFFFFFFLSWSVAPDLRSVKTILAGKLCSFSVYSPEFS